MAAAEILTEIARLPWSERLAIADRIYDDLVVSAPAASSDSEACAIASRRIEELRSGNAQGHGIDEHLARVSALLECR